jgi:prepilin-type N-terminal cleavage/methylation domain-containing protein
MNKKQEGFSLIELLFVVAIISILASIIIGQMDVSRNKSIDTAVIADLKNLRNEVEMYYLDNGSNYTGVCSDSKILVFFNAINDVSGHVPSCNINASADLWAVETVLTDGGFYCIDSTGKAIKSGVSKGVNASCP